MGPLGDVEFLLKKIVEPTIEPKHEVVPGTSKSIHLLLNAVVAFSECLCTVENVCFKDTLMFQVDFHPYNSIIRYYRYLNLKD